MQLDINDLKGLLGFGNTENKLPFEIGKAYLFRTVTHIELGRVDSICGKFVKIVDASWISHTGRYSECLLNGTIKESEPYPDYSIVNTDSLINSAPWGHDLPREPKK